MQYFNGRQERDRDEKPKEEYRREERRDDPYGQRREEYRRDDRDDRESHRYGDRERERDRGGDERRERPRWDEVKPEPERGRDPAPVDGKCQRPIDLLAIVLNARHVDGPRKRKSRWGDATERIEVPGMPVAVMGKVSQTELDNYAIHVRLEEISRKLRTDDVVPPEGQR